MPSVDYLIVGQGLAGSILAYKLHTQGSQSLIIDEGSGNTASRQATGIINPITGRRFVKSWLIENLLPEAQTFYRNLNRRFKASFYKETEVLKILQSNEQVNDFHVRLADPSYQGYLSAAEALQNQVIVPQAGTARIKPVLQIDINSFLDHLYSFFKNEGMIQNEGFDYSRLVILDNGFQYQNIEAKNIIFAEGFKMRYNPYFNDLPIQFAKGEALVIESEGLGLETVLNSKLTITPISKHQYYVGASYDWNDMEQVTTQAKKEYLIKNLEQSIHVPYKILEHKVGIRPTVLDRRPLIGEHHQYKKMYCFNGMGTKGLSLAPYFATQFIKHIKEGVSLNSEVNIERFYHA